MAKYDAIIFDLDGTLWDATAVICEIYNDVLRKNFPQFAREVSLYEVKGYMGKTMYEIGHGIMPEADYDTCIHFMDLCAKEECDFLKTHGREIIFDGLIDTLCELKKDYPLIIVSNCQDGYIESFLDSNKIRDLFVDFQWNTGGNVTKADLNKMVIERNKLKNAVYVGDILGDANSARDAGIDFIFASYGFGKVPKERYVAKLEDIRELPKVLKSL